ncbi:hypothetical protein A2U01_0043244, partial [Trifolium medium]|nr:hypothetical protein [Trifolium medium]
RVFHITLKSQYVEDQFELDESPQLIDQVEPWLRNLHSVDSTEQAIFSSISRYP